MVINSINQINDISSVITVNQITKDQIKLQQEKLGIELVNRIDMKIESLDYIQSEYKKEFILNNGLIIKNRRLNTKRLYKCEKVIAFDTETYEGTCKLLTCSGSKKILNPSFLECIKFLFYLANNSNTYRFFYNLDFDISSILKLWKSNIYVLKKRILRKIKWLKLLKLSLE